MVLYLERAGRFNAASTMIPNPHKCGSMGSKVYSYAVRIMATDARLTPEGFVLNNESIHEYFLGRYGKKAQRWDAESCENMARKAARELFQLVRDSGADVRRVRVTINGSNGARITAHWTVQDETAKGNL